MKPTCAPSRPGLPVHPACGRGGLTSRPPRAQVIRQGEQGDKFFVIWEGQVSCTKNVTPDGTQQNEVMRLKKGDYFGEMALLTDEPRAANVIAKNGSLKALALGREDFDQLLGSLRDVLDRQMGIRVLKGVPLLKDLRDAQLERVAEALHRESFPKGTDVIKEGEEGDSFYIVRPAPTPGTPTYPARPRARSRPPSSSSPADQGGRGRRAQGRGRRDPDGACQAAEVRPPHPPLQPTTADAGRGRAPYPALRVQR